MIKVIIFDIGGVLVPNLGKYIRSKLKKPYVDEYREYEHDLDSGKITLSKVEKIIQNKFHEKIELIKVVIEAAKRSKIDKNVKKIILKLRKNHKLVYLSNSFGEEVLARKKQHIYDFFLFGIDSYKVKLRKPDSKIYKLMLKKLKIRAKYCLFIDDRKKNVKAAKKLGINAIHFKNSKKLIKKLRKFNIEI